MYHSRFAFALAMAALAAILLPSSLTAQITFERTYGGEDWDYGHSAQQTTNDGYIIAGETYSFGAGQDDVYLVRTDAHGDTLWTATCGGDSSESGCSVYQTTDGSFVTTGYTGSFGVGGGDVYLIKTNANGDTLWTRTYGGTNYDYGYSVQQTSDSGYIIAGYTWSFGAGQGDVYLVKTDKQGETLWTRAFGGTHGDIGSSVRQTADGGYVIVGSTHSFGAGSNDIYLIKTYANGDTQWTRTFGGTSADGGSSVQQTSDSGYIIVGSTSSFGAGYEDVYLVKANSVGDTVWTRTFGGTDKDLGGSVQQTPDGGYIVVGSTASIGAGAWDVYLVRTDAGGGLRWARTYGGTGDNQGFSVQRTSDGGYVVAGSTPHVGRLYSDVYLIKTDSLGEVAVAEPKTSPVRTADLSLTCEPNPTAGRTTVRLSPFASRPSPFALRIYDAQGRRVRTFTVNRTPSTVWDGTDELGQPLPSGAYFVRADNGNEHATARIILQR